MIKYKYSPGDKFNLLTIIRKTKYKNKRNVDLWLCRCDCGKYKLISHNELNRKRVKSCGHLVGDFHGDSDKTGIHSIWAGMMSRCYRKDHRSYKNYGGKTFPKTPTEVCDDWHLYRNFKKWAINSGWEPGLSIERNDPNGHYEPSNCSWIPLKRQGRNKSSTLKTTFNGKEMYLLDVGELLKVSDLKRFVDRVSRHGIPIDVAALDIDFNKYTKVYKKIGTLPDIGGSQCSVVDNVDGTKIWFSNRDHLGRSRPGYFSIDEDFNVIETKIYENIDFCDFYETGVMPSHVFNEKSETFMLFVGWSRPGGPEKCRTNIGIARITPEQIFINKEPYIKISDIPGAIGLSTPIFHKIRESSKVLYYTKYLDWIDGEPIYVIGSSIISKSGKVYNHKVLTKNNVCSTKPFFECVKSKFTHLIYSSREIFDYRENQSNSYKLLRTSKTSPNLKSTYVYVMGGESDVMQAYPSLLKMNNKEYLLYNNSFQSAIQVAELVYCSTYFGN